MIADTHIWRTNDGRLVPHGHPDAAVLAYPRGHNIPDQVAVKAGLKAKAKPDDKAKAKPDDKNAVRDGPNNPRRIWPSRTGRQPEEPEEAEEPEESEESEESELDEEALRAEAEELGIKVHGNAKPETIARKIAEAKAEAEAETEG